MAFLELQNLTKHFGATKAVTNVGFSLERGQVLALVGENGAGKSTIVKMLTGIHAPDAGQIVLNGQPQTFSSPQQAWRAGISAIHQETVMFDELSVAENIFMGNQPSRFGLVQWKTLLTQTQKVLKQIDAKISPQAPLKTLSVAQKHLVQIARALCQDSGVVIMDEPTAALSKAEIEDFFRVVAQLKTEQKAIILVTHKFDEIFAHADCYAVLRDGELVGTGTIAQTSSEALVQQMAGREVGQLFPKKAVVPQEVVLSVKDFSHPTEFAGINFSVRSGEILGFYGLIGAGRSEVMQAVFGLNPQNTGQLEVLGKRVQIHSPADAVRLGVVYVPEDRQHQGAILDMNILHNTSLPSLQGLGWWLNRHKETALAMPLAQKLELRAAHLEQNVGELSGGNQQKVVLSKWLATNPKVLILDEPTKGIDVGAKSAVHALMSQMVADGLAVILVSSELPEVLNMSDRIVVMRQGRVVAELNAKNTSAEEVVAFAAGVDL
jgi:rhamnose transport system ATP-binding protein